MVDRQNRTVVIVIVLGALALFLPSVFSAFGAGGRVGGGYGGMMGSYGGMMGGYGGMMGGYGGTGLGWSLFGLISQLGLLLVLIGGAYLLYRAFVSDEGSTVLSTRDTAVEQLRIAYANGEITDEEFETRRERLQSTGGE